MIYNIYWVSQNYPFEVLISEGDTESNETTGYAHSEWVGKSAVKAEIMSRGKLIKFIQENNDYNGTEIFSTIYINLLKDELDGIIDEFPEEAI